ncbi:MAG: acetyl-CoA carboxylase biotin carboxyl carrier protein subunit [Proteobacteria bacterium]|nr:acetyl-CoA carboxylase biotin carboxyl carrier protein subunit [Pseudomonadota bacterium]
MRRCQRVGRQCCWRHWGGAVGGQRITARTSPAKLGLAYGVPSCGGFAATVTRRGGAMKYTVQVGGQEFEATVLLRTHNSITFDIAGRQYQVGVHPHTASARGTQPRAPVRPPPATKAPMAARPRAGSGEVRAPMPGIVVQVIATPGATVSVGDPLIVIEAMKMENCITAPVSGTVRQVETEAGKQVNGGDLLILIGD